MHIVTYDLKAPNDMPEDYDRVIEGLKSAYPVWCHLEESVWLVSTDQTVSETRDTIKDLLGPSDVLFVARLSGKWASFRLGSKRATWLEEQPF